jgi:hypothetical protein
MQGSDQFLKSNKINDLIVKFSMEPSHSGAAILPPGKICRVE